ncbi:hypothetical protein RE432_14800 [Pusillimonas sp. SM2304]|uniref:hypothetical protein n=1 Tax=Pusillimonas sp. SM2304 TaxID=3073241 RepID=UPI002875AA39|nr:hypothetical protein [Pusillimonas sp. SM2304]MDS1141708.1 hypothetical protein [Pusillimonas sp. SM2304]
MQPPDNPTEAKVWAVLIGAAGAAVSLTFIKGLTRWQKLTMVVSGTLMSAIFTQPVIELVNIPRNWSDGVAFLVGLMAWSVVGSFLSMIRKADWWELAKEIIRSWLVRKGG